MFRIFRLYGIILYIAFAYTACLPLKTTSYFTGTKKNILKGEEIELSWHIHGAKYISISDIPGYFDNKGHIKIIPDTTTNYKLYIYSPADSSKSVYKQFRVNVKIPAVFFTGTTRATDEEKVSLRWNVENAEYVEISGFDEIFGLKGQTSFLLDTTKSFTLTATNKYGFKNTRSHTIEIDILEELHVPSEVYFGNRAMLYWKFKKAEAVRIAGFNEHFAPVDTFKFLPKKTKRYTLFVDRTYQKTDTFDFRIKIVDPRIVYFNAPGLVRREEAALLEWQVRGAEKIIVEGLGEDIPADGELKIFPTNPVKYKMKAYSKKMDDEIRIAEREVKIDIFSREFVTDFIKADSLADDMRIDFEILSVDRTKYPDELTLYVVAVDTLGNFVSHLAPPYVSMHQARNYFVALSERIRGELFPIRNFTVREVHDSIVRPLDLALTLDYSGSMNQVIDSLEQSVRMFIDRKNPQDGLSIIKFDDKYIREIGLTKDKNLILNTVPFEGLQGFGGNTALYASGSEGIASLHNSNNTRILILFTDGWENASFRYFGIRAVTADQLVQQAKNDNIQIFTISYGTGTNEKLLAELAKLTDGKFYQIYKPSDIHKVFFEISHLFRNYYVITYKPKELNGQRQIQLTYNNMQEDTFKTTANTYFGTDYSLQSFDIPDDSYWAKHESGKIPVSPPQAIAYFDFDKYILKTEFVPSLDRYASYLDKNKEAVIRIFGHTDSVGSDEYCQSLSENRARTIEKYFISKGIDANRLSIRGCGKRYPVWPDEEYDWQAYENRRIEIVMYE